MAERAYDLLTNDAKRQAMGEAARAKAVNNFSPEKIISDYERLYQRVLR
jgi:glycosyltransferase involved in cell wall biosynthesis